MNLLLALAALLIHEAGHVAATLACGLKVRQVGISRRGVFTRRQAGTPAQNAVIALAGPLANVLVAILWPAATALNIACAITCLLPLPNSDGRHFAAAVAGMRHKEGL